MPPTEEGNDKAVNHPILADNHLGEFTLDPLLGVDEAFEKSSVIEER
jgi:hypothetical protein